MRQPDNGDAISGVISIHGAREHNLKNLSVAIPRGKLVVVTGVSGSGKSTLAFDLLFAEGQRRFLDSMNAYARQFVEQLARPDVDLIEGIPPTVSIEQRNSRGGGKSTVATITEIHHFIRLLFARLGVQHCPDCAEPVEAQTKDQVRRQLEAEARRRGALRLLAPVVRNRKGFHTDVAVWAAQHGYAEVRADGRLLAAGDRLRLDRFREHDVEVVTGFLAGKRAWRGGPGEEADPPRSGWHTAAGRSPHRQHGAGAQPAQVQDARIEPRELIDTTLELAHGTLFALDGRGVVSVHSTERACPTCGRSFPPLDPKLFSYNSSQGWCPRCRGFGELFYLPDVERGARADAIEESWYGWMEGKRELCPECRGARLNPVARAVRLPLLLEGARFGQPGSSASRGLLLERGRRNLPSTIDDFGRATVDEMSVYFAALRLEGRAAEIARDILPEIRERLRFLQTVGLGYLELHRAVPTLSGGEAQRIRLAAQLGSNLSGVLYVLDEPTIGLHARDNEQLLAALVQLKSRGNSVVVVEHDEATMRQADFVIDLGPGAGVRGGQVVAAGSLQELLRHEESITGQCLRARRSFPTRGQRRPVVTTPAQAASGRPISRSARHTASRGPTRTTDPCSAGSIEPCRWLTLAGASVHNLRNLTVRFPLNRLVLITGVSGSGKSTLLRNCLLPALAARLGAGNGRAPAARPGAEGTGQVLAGHEWIRAVYEVDQSPIGRTPRSTPATYVGFFDVIRQLFAQLPEARLRGYGPGRFSFNSAQGRCPACEGAGTIKLEMNFLPPAYVRCEACEGLRFNRETLDLQFAGKNIAEVLELSVAEALRFFASFPRIRRPLEALHDTGLDYLKLGQTSPTLSGGEAQRVKLVSHLLGGLKGRGPVGSPAAGLESPTGRGRETEARQSGDARPLQHGEGGPSGQKQNLFILEEPTIGLHIADVRRLVEVLQRLVEFGHSVIVIEHNLDLIAEADWIIDLGPEGGAGGGEIVAEGTPEQVSRDRHSHTGRFLSRVLASP